MVRRSRVVGGVLLCGLAGVSSCSTDAMSGAGKPVDPVVVSADRAAVEPGGSGHRRQRAGRDRVAADLGDRAAARRGRGQGRHQRVRGAQRWPGRRRDQRARRRAQRGHGRSRRQPRRLAHVHESSDRRAADLGRAGHAVRVRHADQAGRDRDHGRHQRQRPVDAGDRRAVQHRHRGHAVLSDVDRGLPAGSPGSELAGHRAGHRVLPAVQSGGAAGRSGDDHDLHGRDGAVHRARRARDHQPRHLRARGAVRSQGGRSAARLAAHRAATGLERQGPLFVRRLERAAAPPVPLRAELVGQRRRARRRLPGRGQQHVGLAVQLEPRDDERDRDDDEGEDHQELWRDHVRGRQWLLGRIDQPADHRVDLPGPARRHPADLHVPRFGDHRDRGRRLHAAGQFLSNGRVDRADGRQDPGRDQREEGRDQRPRRSDRLSRLGQHVLEPRPTGKLCPDLRDQR